MASQLFVNVIMPAYRAKTISSGAARTPFAQPCPCWHAVIASDDGVDDLAVLASAGIRNTMAEKGLPPWVEAELARRVEEPPGAA